jgi:hypothetical protein
VYGRSQFFNFPRLWATGINLLQLWRELVLVPSITKRKPVKSVKPRNRGVPVNPSLVYETEMQNRSRTGNGRREPSTSRESSGGSDAATLPEPPSNTGTGGGG